MPGFLVKQTGATGNQPTFKASYFGVNIFQRQIILQDMSLTPHTLTSKENYQPNRT